MPSMTGSNGDPIAIPSFCKKNCPSKEKCAFLWDEVFKSGLSKFCGRQPLKYFKGYGLLKQTISPESF